MSQQQHGMVPPLHLQQWQADSAPCTLMAVPAKQPLAELRARTAPADMEQTTVVLSTTAKAKPPWGPSKSRTERKLHTKLKWGNCLPNTRLKKDQESANRIAQMSRI